MIGLTLLELALAAVLGVGSYQGGYVVGIAWKAFKTMRSLFPNVDRSKLTPEERAQLESIEAKFDNPAGRAGADMGR